MNIGVCNQLWSVEAFPYKFSSLEDYRSRSRVCGVQKLIARNDLVEYYCRNYMWYDMCQGNRMSMSWNMRLMISSWKLSFFPWGHGGTIFLSRDFFWWVITSGWDSCLTNLIWMPGKLDGWLPQQFDFQISYIKGKENIVADYLSRRIHVNHRSTISLDVIDLEEKIFHAGKHVDMN